MASKRASDLPRPMPLSALKLLTLALALTVASTAAVAQNAPPAATQPFDYYVLTLSWAPGFCDLGGQETPSSECATGSGDGFVVHGLWPDNDNRPNPEGCAGEDASPAELAEEHGLYPNDRLAAYEYRKHGTCTGLSAHDYFATVRNVRDRLRIPATLQAPHQQLRLSPADVEQAFIAANANLRPDNMAVTCSDGELVDVRFCLSKDLTAYAICRKVARHSCQRDSIAVAPVR
jgi:ribonuclease T2